jgi:hypothetical protein
LELSPFDGEESKSVAIEMEPNLLHESVRDAAGIPLQRRKAAAGIGGEETTTLRTTLAT